MVNTPLPRAVPFEVPPDPLPAIGAGRKLPGPRYDLADVQKRAVPTKILIATEKCTKDLLKLRWASDQVADLISTLDATQYNNSEWCATGNGMTIDCDAYVVKINPVTGKFVPTGIYVKFGFRFPANNHVIVVSCHE